VQPAGFDPRVAAVDLITDTTTVRLVGVYGPTNGMTAENSHRRREFQSRFLGYRPHLPAFEDHDYAFYTGLLALGLRDAYRELNPSGDDHSWINPRFGSQRLDHSLVSVGAGELRACAYDHTTRSDDLSDHAALLTTIGLRTDHAATNGHPPR